MAWQSLEELKFYQAFRLPVESRDDLRAVVELRGGNPVSSPEVTVSVLNISEGGIGIRAEQQWPLGQKMQIQIMAPKMHAEVDGEIVRLMPQHDGKSFTYGIRLESDPEWQKFVQHFVAHLAPERLKNALAMAVRRQRSEGGTQSFELFSLLLNTWQDLANLSEQQKFLEVMLSELVFNVKAAWAAVFLINPEKNCLELKGQYGLSSTLAQEWQFDYRQGVAGAVFTSGKVLNIDASSSFAVPSARLAEGESLALTSALACPLYNGDDKVIGVLQVANKQGQRRFSGSDEQLLKLMALVLANGWQDFRPWAAQSQVRRWSAAFDRELVLIGHSNHVRFLRSTITRCKDAASPLLLKGEKGTGKTLLAKILHNECGRAVHDLLLWDSSLVKTWAIKDPSAALAALPASLQATVAAQAGGSIIWQNIDQLSLTEQAWMMAVLPQLEEKQYRMMATTIRDLAHLAEQGTFLRPLATYWPQEISLLPLRQRLEDLPELLAYFLAQACKAKGLLLKTIAPKVLAALQGYYWPGNIAELQQTITALVAWHEKDHIITDLERGGQTNVLGYGPIQDFNPPYVNDPHLNLPDKLALIERDLILLEIKRQKGNKSQAAKALGIGRESLRKKLLHSDKVWQTWQQASVQATPTDGAAPEIGDKNKAQVA